MSLELRGRAIHTPCHKVVSDRNTTGRHTQEKHQNERHPQQPLNASQSSQTLTQALFADLWRKLSIYVTIPALIIAGVNAWRLWDEHWEHKAHEPPLSEKTEYPYMNIRTKNFFWGDGDKVCFPSAL